MRFVDLRDCPVVAGWTIVRCPACRKEYRNHVYGYVDLTGMTTWSDGFIRSGLYSSWPSLCKCACGALFFRATAPEVGYIPRVEPVVDRSGAYDILAFLRSEEKQAEVDEAKRSDASPVPWWKRIFSRSRDPAVEKSRPTIRRPLKPQTEHLRWPEIPFMDRAKIETEFARKSSFADRELETALRRDYWWSRNRERRWPEAQNPLGGVEQENLRKLLKLLRYELDHPRRDDYDVYEPEQRASKFWLEIGEIQRELGLFDEALASFSLVDGSLRASAAQLKWLATERQAQLVKLNLAGREE